MSNRVITPTLTRQIEVSGRGKEDIAGFMTNLSIPVIKNGKIIKNKIVFPFDPFIRSLYLVYECYTTVTSNHRNECIF